MYQNTPSFCFWTRQERTPLSPPHRTGLPARRSTDQNDTTMRKIFCYQLHSVKSCCNRTKGTRNAVVRKSRLNSLVRTKQQKKTKQVKKADGTHSRIGLGSPQRGNKHKKQKSTDANIKLKVKNQGNVRQEHVGERWSAWHVSSSGQAEYVLD